MRGIAKRRQRRRDARGQSRTRNRVALLSLASRCDRMITVVPAPIDWVESVGRLPLSAKAERRLQQLMNRNNEGQLIQPENLRSDKRPNIPDFSSAVPGEAQEPRGKEIESRAATHEPESPASTDRVMEEICEWKILKEAMGRVKANKGSAGIDGVSVDELPDYAELLVVRDQLLSGTYRPQPVKRVEIPKPDGGVRKLGIPTALDRFVQQAVTQVLQRRWDRTFSDRAERLLPLDHEDRFGHSYSGMAGPIPMDCAPGQ